MPLSLSDKQALVSDLSAVVEQSTSVALADYRGLSVSQMTLLRSLAGESDVLVRVFRNTLTRRAIKGSPFECISDALVGPTVLLFAQKEPAAAAKLLKGFLKKNKTMNVKGFALDGRFLGGEHLAAIAALPSKDEAIAILLSVMEAPIIKLARTMSETYAMAVRVLGSIAEKKKNAVDA